MKKYLYPFLFAIVSFSIVGCSEEPKITPDLPEGNIGVDLNLKIEPYDGQTATDADRDKPTSNSDYFWEASKFPNKVEILYKEDGVEVNSTNDAILVHNSGSYVTVDAQTNNVSGVEIVASGSSADGGLKIYGLSRTLLTLGGLNLKSNIGPAINNQNKKRLMVRTLPNTVNKLEDAVSYSDDPYYLSGNSALTEDRKGCFFSEGHLILSGTGTLRLRGNNRHGLVTDGYLYVRPGVTLVVDDAVRNAIHVKGDQTDGIGVNITGGYIYANTSGTAGRAIRSDLDVTVSGGTLSLNTSGDAVYDETDLDLSSAAGIKADGVINLRGGEITVRSTGKGGKGLNAKSSIYLNADKVTVLVSGEEAEDSARGLSSSPKGLKSDQNIMITSGENLIYATDDGIAANSLYVRNGKTWVYSLDKDGIDVEQLFEIKGGLLITSADGGNAAGVDSPAISITGGTMISTGGGETVPTYIDQFSFADKLDAKKGQSVYLKENIGKIEYMRYILPRTMNNLNLFYSSDAIPEETQVNISDSGSGSFTTTWCGLSY